MPSPSRTDLIDEDGAVCPAGAPNARSASLRSLRAISPRSSRRLPRPAIGVRLERRGNLYRRPPRKRGPMPDGKILLDTVVFFPGNIPATFTSFCGGFESSELQRRKTKSDPKAGRGGFPAPQDTARASKSCSSRGGRARARAQGKSECRQNCKREMSPAKCPKENAPAVSQLVRRRRIFKALTSDHPKVWFTRFMQDRL